jgi:Tfp pilus assembly protein PilO
MGAVKMNLKMGAVDMGCVIFLIAAVSVGGLLIQGNFSNYYSQIQLEKDRSTTLKNKLKLAVSTLTQFQSRHKITETALKELNKKVPDTPNIGEFLRKLHASVKEKKVTLIDFNHTPSQGFDSYKRIPVKIIVQGDFLNIYRVIHDLETMERVFIFEQVVIQRKEEEKFCRATLLANVFQQ